MCIVRVSWVRTFRPFHWWPRIYSGVNGVTTRLLVVGYVGVEWQGRRDRGYGAAL